MQYDPRSRFFEERDGTLLFTGDNGIPLIRYHIADEGGLIGYDEMLAFCANHDFEPPAGPRLPFVYVFGRSHFTVSFFGANVYPENVTVGLEQPEISGWVTGKFVIDVAEDADRDRSITVAVELAPGQQPSPERVRLATESIRTHLCRLNSEFDHYVPAEHQTPQVTLYETGHPDYFPRGVKHRYTR